MKSFKQFIETERLEEGFIFSGSVLASARKSKVAGDKAIRAYEKGRDVLKRGQAGEANSDRLRRLEAALGASLRGQIHTRHQIGSLVAAVVAAQVMRRI